MVSQTDNIPDFLELSLSQCYLCVYKRPSIPRGSSSAQIGLLTLLRSRGSCSSSRSSPYLTITVRIPLHDRFRLHKLLRGRSDKRSSTAHLVTTYLCVRCTVLAQRISLYLWGEARGRVEPAKKSHRVRIGRLSQLLSRVKEYFTAATRPLHVVPAPARRLSPLQTQTLIYFHASSHAGCKTEQFPSVFPLLSPELLAFHAFPFSLSLTRVSSVTHPPCTHATHPPPPQPIFPMNNISHALAHTREHTYKLIIEDPRIYTGCVRATPIPPFRS